MLVFTALTGSAFMPRNPRTDLLAAFTGYRLRTSAPSKGLSAGHSAARPWV